MYYGIRVTASISPISSTSYCTNLSCYVMFKARRAPLKLHPLTSRLMEYRQLLERMEPMNGVVKDQVEALLAKVKEGGEEAVEEQVRRAKKRAIKENLWKR